MSKPGIAAIWCRVSTSDQRELSLDAQEKAVRQALAQAGFETPSKYLLKVDWTSLDLMAFPARWSNRLIVVALDARRGELFTALFRKVPGGVQRVRDAAVRTPQELSAEIQALDEPTLFIGDGALRYVDSFAGLRGVEMAEQGLANPSARYLVQLAHARAMREEFVQPWELEPVYLRLPDAQINWSTREGGA